MIELYNGDCLDYLKQFKDNQFDCVITDPPYGIKIARENKFTGGKAPIFYKGSNWDDVRPDVEYFNQILRVSKNQIIFGGNYFADLLPPTKCWLVWDKEIKSKLGHCELIYTSYGTRIEKFTYMWDGFWQGNMKRKEKRVHPTQKPLPLMEWIIANYTKEGETILDPFMGSGTTGHAAMNFNRPFTGIEKETDYFIKAKERIELASNQLTF